MQQAGGRNITGYEYASVAQIGTGFLKSLYMTGVGMPQFCRRGMATGELAHYFERRFFLIKPTCSAPFPVYPEVWISPVVARQEENL
jgi:hypothetical protein